MEQYPNWLQDLKASAPHDLVLKAETTNSRFRQIQKKHDKVFDEIRFNLGKKQKLMLKLEALQNQLRSEEGDLTYLQGMIDCAEILRTIQVI